ncbi:hypothetical protein PV405_34405 [Streptomyces sp. ME02-6979-3A]|uniref:hypothetical protein n=1 Tax=Streptomyces sp. ME02-6979-3A TaxID=3028673 RepID=UPI0029B38777|nr:hypothetical protein [Streptomyces sp. ME02-6979-3A]MDX3329689.1 hypothetical protein [Streptomyces sp. ME02-6979-3A]
MAVQNSTVERPTLHAPALTPADVAAHEAGSYVRRAAVSYTDLARAQHDQHCARCRTLTEDTDARTAAYGESIRRRDRQQLGLPRAIAGSVR